MVVCLSAALAMLTVAVSAPGSEVRGGTTCPSSAEVAERMAPMLSPQAAFPSGGFVELVDVAARVPGLLDIEVRLRNVGDDAPSAIRRVERNGGCSETADAVAVIAASWAGHYATPQTPTLAEESSSSSPVEMARASATPRSSPTRLSVGLSVGAVAATSGGSAVLAGGEVGARRGRWTMRLQVAATGERNVAFTASASGSAAWRRLLALPSVGFTWGSSRAYVEIGAGPALGLTETRGQGFDTNNTDTGLDMGLSPGLRLGARLAALPVTVWVGGTTMIWLRPHHVFVEGSVGTQALPRLDAWFGGGLTFSFDS